MNLYESTLPNFSNNSSVANSNHFQTITIADKVGNYDCFGTVILIGEKTQFIRERLSALKDRQSWKQVYIGENQVPDMNKADGGREPLVSCSHLTGVNGNIVSNAMIVRLFADTAEDAYYLLHAMLAPLCADYYIHKPSVHYDRDYVYSKYPYANRISAAVARSGTNNRTPLVTPPNIHPAASTTGVNIAAVTATQATHGKYTGTSHVYRLLDAYDRALISME